jgi:hypothetical protein
VFASDSKELFKSLKAQIGSFLVITPGAIIFPAGNKTDAERHAVALAQAKKVTHHPSAPHKFHSVPKRVRKLAYHRVNH